MVSSINTGIRINSKGRGLMEEQDPDIVLKMIEEEARKEHLPIIGPVRGGVLDEVVKRYKPRNVIEIGTLVGYSAIRIARLLPTDGRLTCIEVNPKMAKRAASNIRAAGLMQKVKIVVGDAKMEIRNIDESVDMLFIDAEKSEYMTYLKEAERLLHSGSVVVADNVRVYAEPMNDYLMYVRGSGRYVSITKPDAVEGSEEKDAVEVSVKV
jgi:predicted O-methyltransferase YrrM